MITDARYAVLDYDHPEISDMGIYRIKQEQLLDTDSESVYRIEDRRKVIEQGKKDIITISHVPEEYIETGKYHADADIHKCQCDARKYQHKE